MKSSRLEAFSDGVIAILLTIMVLEFKTPATAEWSALVELLPHFVSYLVSFLYIGIYWGNHHHLIQLLDKVDGKILWANLHLLFWLSLVPFATAWVARDMNDALPTAFYGLILFACGTSYNMLSNCVFALRKDDAQFTQVVRHVHEESVRESGLFFFKEVVSSLAYAMAVGISFWQAHVAQGIYVAVALLWLIPDRRVEKILQQLDSED